MPRKKSIIKARNDGSDLIGADAPKNIRELVASYSRNKKNKIEIKKAENTNLYLSLKDARNYLGVSRPTMMNYIKKGMIKAHKYNNYHWRIHIDDIHKFLELSTWDHRNIKR